jgi:hypothetical protein
MLAGLFPLYTRSFYVPAVKVTCPAIVNKITSAIIDRTEGKVALIAAFSPMADLESDANIVLERRFE